jgi:nicotinate-nucleotide adenylyltransferase
MTPVTPMPIPLDGPSRPKTVIIFGGTFDPPHVGHVELPTRVRSAFEQRAALEQHATSADTASPGPTWLLYVPAARSPHKAGGAVASDADRAQMLRLALGGSPRTSVWTDELDRAEAAAPSYSVETLARARAWLDANGLSDVQLRLLIGADQAVSFHAWREPRRIITLARPLVMIRGEVANVEALQARLKQTKFWKRDELAEWNSATVPVGAIDVSATAIRRALAGSDEGLLSRYLAPSVIDYIRTRMLYISDR